MNFKDFNKALKEHYVEPLTETYRELYRKKFNEEPPANVTLMMDRLIKSGEAQIGEILNFPKASESTE
ncbi:hypothetical protein [Paenibacillus oryzisoli]|uniref:Uncharacterized protein n=1 Tax=Paenibacillus oryzisoli TaxID=1850517 RepID=A0A198ADJ6_9BACL|nr:hypothetical protein [Paenibacillus oryzisoli]OAS19257.1 hypothetical protein A8708_26465 [Paenibacillus oryzisoli]